MCVFVFIFLVHECRVHSFIHFIKMLINLDYYLIDYSNKYNIRCYMLPQKSILEVKTLVMEISMVIALVSDRIQKTMPKEISMVIALYDIEHQLSIN